MSRFVETHVIAIHDAVAAAAAAFTTDTNVVDMAGYNRCLCVLLCTNSGAGTATITLKQSSENAGTSEKALAYTEYFVNVTGTTTSVLTRVEAATCTTGGALTGTNTYVWEVKADEMDIDGGFHFLRMDVASLSNNTAAALFYVLYEPRYARGAEDMTEAIA